MSLKGFHIVFVTISTLCLVGFAAWAFLSDVEPMLRVGGAVSAACGVALAIYGSWFYRNKLKNSNF